MPTLSALLPLALLPLAFTAPVQPSQQAVRLVGSSPASTLSPEQIVKRDLTKLLGTRQPAPRASSHHQRSNTVPITNVIKNGLNRLQTFAGPLKVGTPAQQLPVLFDTGSSDLVLLSACLDGCPNGYFKPDASSSFVNTTTETAAAYAGGAVLYGSAAYETVQIGDTTVRGQRFLAGTDGELTGTTNAAGVMGLAPIVNPYAGVGGDTNWLQAAVAAGSLPANEFSLYFGRAAGAVSELVLGGIDSAHYQGEVVSMPNAPKGAFTWGASVAGTVVDGQQVDSREMIAVVDSGTEVNYVPRRVAAQIYLQLNGTLQNTAQQVVMGAVYDVDFYTFPCNSSLPVGFSFTEASSTEPMYMKPQDVAWYMYSRLPSKSKGTCEGAFVGVDINYPFTETPAALLGLPWLKSFTSVYSFGADGKSPAVSFATSK
ncbi:peptidase A1 family protein [Rhodotorula toruloides]|uniref:Peptidase A1 family protein n=1 Tax=Rhodotorula toruloides TaxID=5286 RepID=A0A511K8C6_RHOTO|nr:peptidase A1 family protein [Rhodotorula toruloides]